MQFDLPEQAEALYADVRSSVYRRSFALSRELQPLEKSDACAKFAISPWGSGRMVRTVLPNLAMVSLQTATKETLKTSL